MKFHNLCIIRRKQGEETHAEEGEDFSSFEVLLFLYGRRRSKSEQDDLGYDETYEGSEQIGPKSEHVVLVIEAHEHHSHEDTGRKEKCARQNVLLIQSLHEWSG